MAAYIKPSNITINPNPGNKAALNMSTEKNTATPAERLRAFVKWVQVQGLCKSESHFERQCGLCPKYISNNIQTSKGNMGTEMLGRIVKVYPQLNLVWICTGDGSMTTISAQDNAPINFDYKQAYEGAMMQIEALNRIISKLNTPN